MATPVAATTAAEADGVDLVVTPMAAPEAAMPAVAETLGAGVPGAVMAAMVVTPITAVQEPVAVVVAVMPILVPAVVGEAVVVTPMAVAVAAMPVVAEALEAGVP